MADIIQLLPDSIANQIAAGEVVQRPASVVKELMENAIDAQCSTLQVIVKNGGKTLVQVIDNGCGMSETDARMSFERHATSKIREANDLFALRTMGFRGEALASIAAVAEVELRTRRPDDEVGTLLQINGSEVIQQEPLACPVGTNFCVKNLFFNIPARRKFLKSESAEFKNIVTEFQRVALANPQVEMRLQHNDHELYFLPKSGLKQRIVAIFGKALNSSIVECSTQNSIVNVSGYVGKPEIARKTPGNQFFFVNNRFMKSMHLHRAVMNAYARLIPEGYNPPYFIYLDVDPANIDVNIHPTKTEIKFEDEQSIWGIIHAATREALGRFTLTPTFDFDPQTDLTLPYISPSAPVPDMPGVAITPNYNPFEAARDSFENASGFGISAPAKPYSPAPTDVYAQPPSEPERYMLPGLVDADSNATFESTTPRFMQIKGKYIATSIASGLMLIDVRRAHIRILFEQFMANADGQILGQRELFPSTVDLSPQHHALLIEHQSQLTQLGLELSDLGHNTISVNSMPVGLQHVEPSKLIDDMLLTLNEDYTGNAEQSIKERLVLSLAKAAALNYVKPMNTTEMQALVDSLFACNQPHISPDGLPVVSTIDLNELDRRFRK